MKPAMAQQAERAQGKAADNTCNEKRLEPPGMASDRMNRGKRSVLMLLFYHALNFQPVFRINVADQFFVEAVFI